MGHHIERVERRTSPCPRASKRSMPGRPRPTGSAGPEKSSPPTASSRRRPNWLRPPGHGSADARRYRCNCSATSMSQIDGLKTAAEYAVMPSPGGQDCGSSTRDRTEPPFAAAPSRVLWSIREIPRSPDQRPRPVETGLARHRNRAVPDGRNRLSDNHNRRLICPAHNSLGNPTVSSSCTFGRGRVRCPRPFLELGHGDATVAGTAVVRAPPQPLAPVGGSHVPRHRHHPASDPLTSLKLLVRFAVAPEGVQRPGRLCSG